VKVLGEEWMERIVLDPAVLSGKPMIRGTRISVEFVLGLLAEGWTHEEILDNYPQLTREDINATYLMLPMILATSSQAF
jgi:uncharacterized protein (DUF433 family)